MSLSRRDALKLAAVAAATPLLPAARAEAAAAAARPAAGRFLGASEMALLDELVEMIVPADEHSGGARAAGVAAYIDARLADYDPAIPDLREERERWKAGLATVDALARAATGKAFLESTPAERTALLERLAVQKAPKTEEPEEQGQRFFVELKAWTVRGYYTSKVGLHDDLQYLGNKAIVEFSGTDVSTLPPER